MCVRTWVTRVNQGHLKSTACHAVTKRARPLVNSLDLMKPAEGRKRIIIEEVQPQVNCGRYSAKRTIGDIVTITAVVFGDGHDHVAGRLLYRHNNENDSTSTPLTPLTNNLSPPHF